MKALSSSTALPTKAQQPQIAASPPDRNATGSATHIRKRSLQSHHSGPAASLWQNISPRNLFIEKKQSLNYPSIPLRSKIRNKLVFLLK